jgi:hypothetical protein
MLEGQYRQNISNFNEVFEDQRSRYLLGGVKLNTSSYVWDKDFLLLDLGGAFSPETRDEKYITVPDRSEVRTLKKVDLLATLFNNKPLSVHGSFNLDQNVFNRELLTNVKTRNIQWGTGLTLNNRFLPLTVTCRKQNWQQEETQTGRMFYMDRLNILARASKSFGSRDRSELIFSRNDYDYRYGELSRTQNLIHRVDFHNTVYFDKERQYNLNSRMSWHAQKGSSQFRRAEMVEGLSFRLPYQLRLSASFNLYNLKDPVQVWDQKRSRVELEHRLYKSLTSKVYLEYSHIRQSAELDHIESDLRGGLDLKYTKKIPTGSLNLAYRYFRQGYRAEGPEGHIRIFQEEHMLTDGLITTLSKPYVDVASVVVRDLTGAVVYQPDFDYQLFERGGYTELQRIPGGLIADGTTVLVDYTYRQPGDYSYVAGNHQFTASVILLNRFVELYYRYEVQDYPKREEVELLTLDYHTQHLYGIRLDARWARGGIESDHFQSNIIPYTMMRYYLDLNWSFQSKLQVTCNGTVRDYRKIAGEDDQQYVSLSGKVIYGLRPGMKLSFQAGYLNQRGENIDLNLLTGRMEFLSVFNKLELRTGLEVYRREYEASNFEFRGAYLRLTRRF